jgi:hypothetical protein
LCSAQTSSTDIKRQAKILLHILLQIWKKKRRDNDELKRLNFIKGDKFLHGLQRFGLNAGYLPSDLKRRALHAFEP